MQYSQLHNNQNLVELVNEQKIYLKKFQSSDIEELIKFIQSEHNIYIYIYIGVGIENRDMIMATGGGAFKYNSILKERLKMEVHKIDEMKSLIVGMNFVVENVEDSSFMYSVEEGHQYDTQFSQEYPHLLVNIGSGVSMLRIEASNEYKRVAGTMIGGGTLLGLSRMLIGETDFNKIHELSKNGDHSKVDMLIEDIYGENIAQSMALPQGTVASSFGKAAVHAKIVERRDQLGTMHTVDSDLSFTYSYT